VGLGLCPSGVQEQSPWSGGAPEAESLFSLGRLTRWSSTFCIKSYFWHVYFPSGSKNEEPTASSCLNVATGLARNLGFTLDHISTLVSPNKNRLSLDLAVFFFIRDLMRVLFILKRNCMDEI